MKILFLHQNFPGQFKNIAPELVKQGHQIVAMTMNASAMRGSYWNGVKIIPYRVARHSTPGIHPWLVDSETKFIRGEAVCLAGFDLRKDGFYPDVIISHPGWGESLFIKEVWPNAKLGIYCEFFYNEKNADVGFDAEFPDEENEFSGPRIRAKNLNNILHFDLADAGISPTRWQASTFPDSFRGKITVIHDGINTDQVRPNSLASLEMVTTDGVVTVAKTDEIVTFVNRDLEPARGYHQFMRAIPQILRKRPNARILIVGGDDVSYGSRPDAKKYGQLSWKQIFFNEMSAEIGAENGRRISFLGRISYENFIAVLQISTVHVYLTYPFVLSWSLLEAMSAGCAIVASDTPPVLEVIEDRVTGHLVSFFNREQLADEVCALLADSHARNRLGVNARSFVRANYDLQTVCLPQQLKWIEKIATE